MYMSIYTCLKCLQPKFASDVSEIADDCDCKFWLQSNIVPNGCEVAIIANYNIICKLWFHCYNNQ